MECSWPRRYRFGCQRASGVQVVNHGSFCLHTGQWTALMREGETMDHARVRGNACGQGIGCCVWMRPHQGRARPTQPPCPHEQELMCRMPRTPINGAGGLTWCTSEYRSGHVLPHTGVRGCGGRAPRPCGRVVGMAGTGTPCVSRQPVAYQTIRLMKKACRRLFLGDRQQNRFDSKNRHIATV